MSKRRRLLAGVLLLGKIIEEEEEDRRAKQTRVRKIWSRDLYLAREVECVFKKMIWRLKNEGENFYKKFVRVSFAEFEEIHEKIKNKIQKQDTVMRKAISTEERLALTLWFLASGDSFNDMSLIFHIPPCTAIKIVIEVCKALFEEMKDEYLKVINYILNLINLNKLI